MTPHFCVLRMSKVPGLPHILGFGRVRRGVPFFSVFCVMNLRRCFVETEAFRDFPAADDAFVFLSSWERISICKRMKKH